MDTLRPVRLHRIDPGIAAVAGAFLGLIVGLAGSIMPSIALGGLATIGGLAFGAVFGAIYGLLAGGLGALVLNAILPRMGGLRIDVADAPESP